MARQSTSVGHGDHARCGAPDRAARRAGIGYAVRMRYLRWAGVMVVASLAMAGCESKSCALRGCSNQFSATLSRADGSFPAGAHRVDIIADGVTMSCAFNFAGSGVVATCPSGLDVTVGPAETCMEFRSGNGVGYRCDPIPGQFIERLTLRATPSQMRVVQSVDGVALLDQAMAPTYEAAYPNGPECEPVCQQATATLSLP